MISIVCPHSHHLIAIYFHLSLFSSVFWVLFSSLSFVFQAFFFAELLGFFVFNVLQNFLFNFFPLLFIVIFLLWYIVSYFYVVHLLFNVFWGCKLFSSILLCFETCLLYKAYFSPLFWYHSAFFFLLFLSILFIFAQVPWWYSPVLLLWMGWILSCLLFTCEQGRCILLDYLLQPFGSISFFPSVFNTEGWILMICILCSVIQLLVMVGRGHWGRWQQRIEYLVSSHFPSSSVDSLDFGEHPYQPLRAVPSRTGCWPICRILEFKGATVSAFRWGD